MSKYADNKNMGKQTTFTFQPNPEIMAILKEQAKNQDRSVSWLINHYVKKALETEGLIEKEKLRQ